ncbi:PKD domain-containing protein, partial [bacterium]|nr:PKD domain-containing protein [bacterium]
SCDAQSGTLDPVPSDPNPLVLGAGRDGTTNYLTDYACANNTYYWTMHLEPGDPFVINNNIPLMRHRPIPDFVADTTWGVNNLCVEFSNLTQYGDSYVWDFGDGTTYATQDNETPVTHCYNSGKKHYTVSLTATNESGTVTETKEDYIEVSRSVDLGFNATLLGGIPGTEIQFTNESGGNVSHFLWNFGDATTEGYRHSTRPEEKIHPVHNYDEAGNYSVSLSAWGRGGSDTLRIADFITIDADYLELALVDSSETVPGYGWSHAIDQDIVSTNCKVLAPNNQPWAIFMFPDGGKRAVERVRLMVNTLAGDNYPTHLASEVEVWASMNGADFNFVTEAVIKDADAWVEIGFEPILATNVK